MTRYFDFIDKDESKGSCVQVGLEHFAAIMGMTKESYLDLMREAFRADALLDLIHFESRSELEMWLIKREHYEKRTPFCIMFRLSLNKTHDDAMFCICNVVMDGETYVAVKTVKIGFADMPPEEAVNLDIFEILFCDIDINTFGAR